MAGDPGRIDWKNVTVRIMLQQAYGVKDYQIMAPIGRRLSATM